MRRSDHFIRLTREAQNFFGHKKAFHIFQRMFDDMMRHGERFWSSGNSAEVVEWIAAPNSQGIGQHTRQPKRAVCGENSSANSIVIP
jgi:hypothetical protein